MYFDSVEGLTEEQIAEVYSSIIEEGHENNNIALYSYLCQYVSGCGYACAGGYSDLSCNSLLNWGYYYIYNGETHTVYSYLAYARCRGGSVRVDYCV